LSPFQYYYINIIELEIGAGVVSNYGKNLIILDANAINRF